VVAATSISKEDRLSEKHSIHSASARYTATPREAEKPKNPLPIGATRILPSA
jgi:hypothetical protein